MEKRKELVESDSTQELTENEIKKEYLFEYRLHVRRIKRIEAEIEEIRAMKMHPSVISDGLPHGSRPSDLSSYASSLDGLERELIQERYLRIKSYMDISRRIKQLKNEMERDVLFYRYIKGMDWWEIAERMGYCERHIHRYHGRALINLEIPKDVMECQ